MRFLVFAYELDELELKAELDDYDAVEVLISQLGYISYDVIEQIWTDSDGVMTNPPSATDSELPRQYREIFDDEIGYNIDDLNESYNMFKKGE